MHVQWWVVHFVLHLHQIGGQAAFLFYFRKPHLNLSVNTLLVLIVCWYIVLNVLKTEQMAQTVKRQCNSFPIGTWTSRAVAQDSFQIPLSMCFWRWGLNFGPELLLGKNINNKNNDLSDTLQQDVSEWVWSSIECVLWGRLSISLSYTLTMAWCRYLLHNDILKPSPITFLTHWERWMEQPWTFPQNTWSPAQLWCRLRVHRFKSWRESWIKRVGEEESESLPCLGSRGTV